LEPDKVTVETSGGGEELLAGFHLHDPAFEDWLRDERLRHEDQPAAGVQPSSSPFPDRPSIAVLPFTNMSGDPEQEYFSDGITEDIITELSRFHSLIVIARSSSFHYKGSSPKVQDVGRELGVYYVVEGSVRKAGSRVRVSAQLVECESGNHVWAERYDRDLEDIFAVQDELTRTVVSTIAGRIEAVGHGRASRMSADSLQAYDLVLRARRHTYAFTRPDNAEAQKLLARAIVLDPANARAHAAFSMSHMLDWFSHWEKEGDDSLTESHRLAKMAVSLDDTDCYAQWSLGCTYLCGRRYRNSRFHLEKALDLNPNDVEARALYGLFLTYIGQPEEALAEYDQAKKVDPHHLTWLPWYYGFAFFTALRFNDAIEVLEPIEQPANEVRGILAASYALVGRLEDANLMLGSFLRAAEDEMVDFPGRSAAVWMQIWHSVVPFKNDADREVWADGLRKAGLDP
jgi:adenylate cyclase